MQQKYCCKHAQNLPKMQFALGSFHVVIDFQQTSAILCTVIIVGKKNSQMSLLSKNKFTTNFCDVNCARHSVVKFVNKVQSITPHLHRKELCALFPAINFRLF